MAFLNEQERDKLLEELKKKNFNQAKGKLARMDPQGRLAYYRNVQNAGEWVTRYDLEGLGTRVTLVEQNLNANDSAKNKNDFQLVRITVEPLPGNRT